MRRRISNFQLFITACLAALLLVLLGLRWYFSQSQLDSRLGAVIEAKAFTATKGTAQFDEKMQVLRVNADSNQASQIVVKDLNITSGLFERVDVAFANKASQQVLTLSVIARSRANDSPQTSEQPILYTDNAVSRLAVSSLVDNNQKINQLQLSTPRLIAPYALKSIRFVPKTFDTSSFGALLWKDLTQHTRAVLLSPKQFLLIYFSVVAIIFTGLLLWAKRSLSSVWWWVLIAAWLLLDLRYFYQQSQSLWGQRGDMPTTAVHLVTTWGKSPSVLSSLQIKQEATWVE